MGKLSTHILDTVHGGPAPNVLIELYSMDPVPKLLVTARTNADPAPLRSVSGAAASQFNS